MNDTIQKFFEKGKLLTPDALEILKDNTIDWSRITGSLILEKKDVENIIEKGEKIKIIKNLTEKKTEMSTEDFILYSSTKYEKIKKILTERINKPFVSLNKIDASRKEVYTIGMVKEIKEKDGKFIIELEDMTGTIKVSIDRENFGDLDNDDVVGIQGIAGGNLIFGKKIIVPDFPIRKPATGKGKGCFVSDFHLEQTPKKDVETFFTWFENSDIKYLFVAGDIGDRNYFEKLLDKHAYNKKVFVVSGEVDDKDYPQLAPVYNTQNTINLSNPSMVDVNGVKILMVHNTTMSDLKKRYLGKGIIYSDHLVLEDLPDIIHFGHNHEARITNYKSITLVNSGSLLTEFRPVVIDFSTREAEQVSFDTLK